MCQGSSVSFVAVEAEVEAEGGLAAAEEEPEGLEAGVAEEARELGCGVLEREVGLVVLLPLTRSISILGFLTVLVAADFVGSALASRFFLTSLAFGGADDEATLFCSAWTSSLCICRELLAAEEEEAPLEDGAPEREEGSILPPPAAAAGVKPLEKKELVLIG